MNSLLLRRLAGATLPLGFALSLSADVAITGTQWNPPAGLRLLFTDTVANGNRAVQFSPALTASGPWDPVPGAVIHSLPAGGYEALVPGASGVRGFYRIVSQASSNDPDGDGLSTAVELQGWTVVVKNADGSTTPTRVFSNPNLADTDGDGLTDAEERSLQLDPNLIDTDGDGLDDFAEARVYFTNPASVDSDDDANGDSRFLDGAEVQRGTSPNLADTDGDRLLDRAEVLGGKNPLVSDLPRPVVDIDENSVILTLNVTYSDQNSTTRAYTTTLGQSTSSSLSRSDATSTQTSIEASASITAGVEATAGLPPGVTASVSATVGLTAGYVEQNTVTVDSTRSQESQRQEEKHQEDAATFGSETASGKIALTLKVRNTGKVGFTLKNLIVTALRRNPAFPSSPQPVGTLQVTGLGDGATVAVNGSTGPLNAEVDNVSAELMKALLQDPTQLVFGIGNFDLLDEEGRNYAFLEDVNRPLTAQVTLDFGNGPVNNELGRVERYRVATNVRVDQDGFSEGVLLKDVLEKYLRSATETKGIPYTMGTNSVTGLHVLKSLRGVATDSAVRHFWVVAGSRPELVQGVNFDEIRLLPTDRINLFFVTDEDDDKLNDREEFVYGTSDRSSDTDGDGLSDFEEIRVGWDVAVANRPVRRVFPDPRFQDTDGDGWSDAVERQHGTDPRMKDTDLDGFPDNVDPNPLVYTLVPPTISMEAPVVNGTKVTVKGASGGRPAVFNVSVNWGDNSSASEAVAPGGAAQFPYAFEHTYAGGGTFTITATVRDVNGQTAVATRTATTVAFPNEGRLGEYLFNDGGFLDSSGNKKDGIPDFGNPFTTPTLDSLNRPNRAVHLDASANSSDDGRGSVRVGTGSGNTGWGYSKNFSLSAWIRRESGNNQPYFIVGQDTSPGLFLVLGRRLAFGVPFSENRSANVPVLDSSDIPAGVWTHVAVTVSTTGGDVTCTLYRNGVQVDQRTRGDTSFVYPAGAIGRIGIWASAAGNPSRDFNFKGDLDSVRIYNRALRADEVTALANDWD